MRAGRRPWMPRVCLSSKVKAIPLNLFGSLIGFVCWLISGSTAPTWGSRSRRFGWVRHQCCLPCLPLLQNAEMQFERRKARSQEQMLLQHFNILWWEDEKHLQLRWSVGWTPLESLQQFSSMSSPSPDVTDLTFDLVSVTLMTGTAVSKTMSDKEDGEGGAEDIEHPNHKIKLNIASHPHWRGTGSQSKHWINQNSSIVTAFMLLSLQLTLNQKVCSSKTLSTVNFFLFLLCWLEMNLKTDSNIGLLPPKWAVTNVHSELWT